MDTSKRQILLELLLYLWFSDQMVIKNALFIHYKDKTTFI